MQRLAVFITLFLLISCNNPSAVKLSGPVFGTSYNIQYCHENNINFEAQIDSLFYVVNKSMSTYIPTSIISKVNSNQLDSVDYHFKKVFNTSKQIYTETNGYFDPTIGIVVNAWDFGPEGKIAQLDSLKIDSLMQFVGLDKVKLTNKIITKPKGTFIDFNAIAKGYAVDVVAEFLKTKGVTNFLVEIGGEIRVSGKNVEKNSDWKIGIDDPNFSGEQHYSKVISLTNAAMATSGTYRKFKIDEHGNRYAHIINTQTGYPSKTNILSVSVIAPTCMEADAYATAFQAMGIQKIKSFLKLKPDIKAYLIFENSKNELETLSINNFPEK